MRKQKWKKAEFCSSAVKKDFETNPFEKVIKKENIINQ